VPDHEQSLVGDTGRFPQFAAHAGATLATDYDIMRQPCLLTAPWISYRCRCIDDKDT